MSVIKMQESVPDDEATLLRKQAADKDNHYATLENELFKKNNDLIAVKGLLNETLCKLRDEADRSLKLETDLNRRVEDLRAERLNRQNLEASLKSASEKLTSEEQAAKYLQMELDTYASRLTSQHEMELKRIQHEKATLETRVRALEAQTQANKPSQLPTRLPRPTTFSGASSTAADARIATLQCDLSKAERELADATKSLAAAQQEAAKVPRLQSDLIAADNSRMRAERAAKAEQDNAESVQELLKEREEELEYWRNTAGKRSLDGGKLEDALRERDEAVKSEEETRKREMLMRTRLEELEEKEAELVMEREEALNELHQLQAEMFSTPKLDETTFAELRASLAERESALLNARGYTAELQQMYRDTLNACEKAEARVEDLKRQLQPPKDDSPPLIIISPPPSPSSSKPFLLQPKPMKMSAEDEAVVARLLTAIERLRGERDALRRDLYFARVEHRVEDDALRDRLGAAESQVRRLEEAAAVSVKHLENATAGSMDEVRVLNEEIKCLQHQLERTNAESSSHTVELAAKDSEIQTMRLHAKALEESREKTIVSSTESSRIAVSTLILVQHLQSRLELAEVSEFELAQAHDELLRSRDELARMLDEAVHHGDEASAICAQVETRLAEAVQTNDEALGTQRNLQAELATSHARLTYAVKDVEDRDIRLTEMQSKLSELQTEISDLQCELSGAREELKAAETRHSAQQLSTLASADNGAAEALKSQLEVLEQRVLRRTEQIGMLQHDIKRLETNLRVAEDTITELTAELETLGQERACLLEDCGQAREARDEAHRRIEELEVEMETLTQNHLALKELKDALKAAQAQAITDAAVIETMVHVVAESTVKSRTLSTALTHVTGRLAASESYAKSTEAHHSHALAEVERLSLEIDSTALTLRDKTAELDVLTEELTSTKDETQHLTIALERLNSDVQAREHDSTTEKQHLTDTIEELKGRLAAAQISKDTLSQQSEAARLNEKALRAQLERDIISETQRHAAILEELEGCLAAAQASEDALSQELDTAISRERDIQVRFEQVQEECRAVAQEAQSLSSTVASLEQTLDAERSRHSNAMASAEENFERTTCTLEAQVEETRELLVSLRAEHADAVQDLTMRLEEAKAYHAKALEDAASHESFQLDLRRLRSEHADEILVLRSRLDELTSQADSLRVQLQTATETIVDLESDIEVSVERYDATQAEIRGLEHALAGARAQLDEHDASINALQREKIVLQSEQTRLEAEIDRSTTKYQYVEQQARRSDHDVVRLKSEVDRLRAEATKSDEAAQAAEINISFKTNQFEQKLAAMQRELQKQQSHRQCQENIAELNEKNEYLEEILRMKSIEIEENDDRFIDALKEKKRLASKVESLTRKVQSLQTKLAAITPPPAPLTAIPPLPVPRPKTPSPPIPSMPPAGPSTRPPTRIPSSPAVALRSRTPEPSRRALVSRMGTPEPPVPSLPQIIHKTPETIQVPRPSSRVGHAYGPMKTMPSASHTTSTPSTSSGSRKRRAPDDFDSPAPLPAQAIVAPGSDTTPRHLRRPTTEGRGAFTPTRHGSGAPLRPALTQTSPLRRSMAPLAESTNSPRGSRPIGLGKPASASKPPMRSWLSRTRAPSTVGGDTRSASVLGVRP